MSAKFDTLTALAGRRPRRLALTGLTERTTLGLTDLTEGVVHMVRVAGSQIEISSGDYRKELLARMDVKITESLLVVEAAGAILPRPEEVANEWPDLIPVRGPNEMAAMLGPFYDSSGVMRLLGIPSKQALESRRKKSSLLAMKTGDGKWVYPVFQFKGRAVHPGLVPAIRAFRGQPGWSAGTWFVTPHDDLREQTPLEWARQGGDADWLKVLAARTAHAWAH